STPIRNTPRPKRATSSATPVPRAILVLDRLLPLVRAVQADTALERIDPPPAVEDLAGAGL
ncbi:hypothetical protein, partial [Acinetobacter baumannii]|uniref:hypothetical protein n=1 Tax=Acinetobacter baumannii TaxID=470 RepID=UPI001BB466DD